MISVAVLNRSTVVADADAARMTAAVAVQVARDFGPAWGITASVAFVPGGLAPPRGAWPVYILDDADQQGALGYHTDEDGTDLPYGKVFARTVAADGGSLSVTLSHEVLEMLGDPFVNLAAVAETNRGPVVYAFENCDAVEDDQFGYQVNGVQVSDFVLPSWFDPKTPQGVPLDFKRHCSRPLQLLPGGYIGVLTGRGWTQYTGDMAPHRSAHPDYRGNRWHRRVAKAEAAAEAAADAA